MNPSRRGWEGQLVTYVSSLGVEAITGKPYKPSSQGKNERFHQTLFRWMDKQPLTHIHAELQAQVEQFDLSYNTERPHQWLPGRITPQQFWDARATAEAPRPKPVPVLPKPPLPKPAAQSSKTAESAAQDGTATACLDAKPSLETGGIERLGGTVSHPADNGRQELRVYSNGVVKIGRTLFSAAQRMGGRNVIAVWDRDSVVFADSDGEIIAEYIRPPEGTKYIGMSKARARFRR